MRIVVAILSILSTGFAAAPAPDIVVYSGVPCGIAASITAAREGPKGMHITRADPMQQMPYENEEDVTRT
jgi:hypothetical protein